MSQGPQLQPNPHLEGSLVVRQLPLCVRPEHFTPPVQKPWTASTKRPRSGPAAPGVEEERWNSREEKDRKPDPLKFTPARKPGPTFDTTAAWSPLSLFHLFFSAAVTRKMIDNTNANAAKRIEAGLKFRWAPLTVKDFYIFLSIVLFSGLVQVHHRSDYWRKRWPYNFAFPREQMSRDRFEAILWSLHLSSLEDDDKNKRKRQTANSRKNQAPVHRDGDWLYGSFPALQEHLC